MERPAVPDDEVPDDEVPDDSVPDGPGPVDGVPTARPPHALHRAAALVALEGLGLTVLGAVFVTKALAGQPVDRSGAVLLGLLIVVLGLLLLPVARGLAVVRRGVWAPTVLLQVFAGIAAVGALQGGAPQIAVPLGLLAGAVLYQLATPEARLARGGG